MNKIILNRIVPILLFTSIILLVLSYFVQDQDVSFVLILITLIVSVINFILSVLLIKSKANLKSISYLILCLLMLFVLMIALFISLLQGFWIKLSSPYPTWQYEPPPIKSTGFLFSLENQSIYESNWSLHVYTLKYYSELEEFNKIMADYKMQENPFDFDSFARSKGISSSNISLIDKTYKREGIETLNVKQESKKDFVFEVIKDNDVTKGVFVLEDLDNHKTYFSELLDLPWSNISYDTKIIWSPSRNNTLEVSNLMLKENSLIIEFEGIYPSEEKALQEKVKIEIEGINMEDQRGYLVFISSPEEQEYFSRYKQEYIEIKKSCGVEVSVSYPTLSEVETNTVETMEKCKDFEDISRHSSDTFSKGPVFSKNYSYKDNLFYLEKNTNRNYGRYGDFLISFNSSFKNKPFYLVVEDPRSSKIYFSELINLSWENVHFEIRPKDPYTLSISNPSFNENNLTGNFEFLENDEVNDLLNKQNEKVNCTQAIEDCPDYMEAAEMRRLKDGCIEKYLCYTKINGSDIEIKIREENAYKIAAKEFGINEVRYLDYKYYKKFKIIKHNRIEIPAYEITCKKISNYFNIDIEYVILINAVTGEVINVNKPLFGGIFFGKFEKDENKCEKITAFKAKGTCQRQNASSMDDCRKIEYISEKDHCIEIYAEKLEDCNEITGRSKDNCIFDVSTKMEDCSLMQEEHYKSRCIIKHAEKLSDCENLNEKYKGDCYYKIAVNKNNLSICYLISSDMDTKDKCFLGIAENLGDPEICENIRFSDRISFLKNSCFVGVAVKSKDIKICERVTDYQKTRCLEYF